MSGRGRPRKFDVEEAIAQAMDLFHRRGYDGVGVAELSKTIGITAPSLYSAFGSKRELFERALKRYVQTHGCWLPEALAEREDLEGAIARLFLRAAEVYAADPERPGCLVIDGTRNCADAEARALTAGFSWATRGVVRDRIANETDLLESEMDALADYAVMILVGLSGSARDGVAADRLRVTAEIAAGGFGERLKGYRN